MSDSTVQNDVAVQVPEDDKIDLDKISIESLIQLINTQRLENIQNKSEKELKELRERQGKVAEVHKIMKAINAATDKDGKLDASKNEELKGLLQRAKELGIDINTKEAKKSEAFKFNKSETERIIENVRMTIEDLNVQNDMQLQTVSRLTNERYETYQMARTIMKTLHDAGTTVIRGIKGG